MLLNLSAINTRAFHFDERWEKVCVRVFYDMQKGEKRIKVTLLCGWMGWEEETRSDKLKNFPLSFS
jgi:hypothetical protein